MTTTTTPTARRLRSLALAALAWAIATPGLPAQQNLLDNSPFLPFGWKPPPERKIPPPRKKPEVTKKRIEYRGFSEWKGKKSFAIYDHSVQRTFWVPLNDPKARFHVKSYDLDADKVVVNLDGESEELTFKEAEHKVVNVALAAKAPSGNAPAAAAAKTGTTVAAANTSGSSSSRGSPPSRRRVVVRPKSSTTPTRPTGTQAAPASTTRPSTSSDRSSRSRTPVRPTRSYNTTRGGSTSVAPATGTGTTTQSVSGGGMTISLTRATNNSGNAQANITNTAAANVTIPVAANNSEPQTIQELLQGLEEQSQRNQ